MSSQKSTDVANQISTDSAPSVNKTVGELDKTLTDEYKLFSNNKFTTNFKDSFSSVNPAGVLHAVEFMKSQIKKVENNVIPNYNDFNIYFTLGTRHASDEFFIGMMSGLLWLKTYMLHLKEQRIITDADYKNVDKVFTKAKIPDTTDLKPSYYYSSFLYSISKWCGNPVTTEVKTDIKPIGSNVNVYRNNYDLVSYVTKCCLGSFPAVPYTAYYIGSINGVDPQEFLEKIKNKMPFDNFFSQDSIMINNPKFELTNAFAPVTECSYSPFREQFVVQKDGAKTEWITIFRDSEEFEKLCIDKGLNLEEVKKYVLGMTLSEHKDNLEKNHPIAKLIDSSTVFNKLFELTAEEFEQKKTSWSLNIEG